MIGVVTTSAAYRAAVAELPLSARLVDDVAGAIVVVPSGESWADAAFRAAAAGAAAIVLVDPTVPTESERAADGIGVPVVVDRPLLRPDVVGLARAGRGLDAARMLVVDATAPAHRVRAVARDALGWLRVLGGGEALSVLVSDRGLALLQNRAGITMTSTVVATHRPGAGRLRVRALGETITNIDAEGRHACVETSSAAGRLVAPARFESPERLALRRALDAVTTGTDPGDLAELFADAALVPRILGA